MKKKVLIFSLLIIPFLIFANGLIIKEKEFDAGEILEGKPIVHEFILKNNGKTSVRIKNVFASCGCTAVRFDREIPPSGEGKIVLRVRTQGYSGNIRKIATVYTDDKEIKSFKLIIRAKVKPIYEIKPNKFIFQRKSIGEEVIREVTVNSAIFPHFKIEKIDLFPKDKIKAEFFKEKEGWKIKIIFPENLPKGNNRGFIRVWTDRKSNKSFSISYLCRVEGKIRYPEIINFYSSRSGISYRVINFLSREKKLKIKVKVCPSFLKCFLHKVSNGYLLLVVYDKKTEKPKAGEIILKTNIKGEKELKVKYRIK